MAKVKKAQMGYRVRGEGRSCGIERQMRKDERQSEREWRKIDRQGTREAKREERQAKREERKAPKSMKNGGKTPARKIKRAQTGIEAAADNTRVRKPIVKPSVERTSAQEKLNIAKQLYRDNPSKVFKNAVDSAQARLSRAPK